MRGQGRVFRPVVRGEHTKVWWLDYSVRGERHRESSGFTSKRAAQRLLRQRIGDREEGKLIGNPGKVTLADLQALHEKQFDLDALRTKDRVKQLWAHLTEFFGATAKVTDVTPRRLDDYAVQRLEAKAARQTVNNELSALRRGFRLAIEKGLLAVAPVIKLPKVRNARSGFFETGDFAALVVELPDWLQPVIRFLRFTGWRKGEALGLTWDRVDWAGQVITLAADQTKGGDKRTFPFGLAPDLKTLLEEQRASRNGPYVFHRNGQRIPNDLRDWWDPACKRAGLDGRLVHDLRRTAARDFRRQGVSEGEIMRLCGWKTRAMFDRYNIIDEADLAAAVAKRFASTNGKQPANNDAPQVQPEQLS